MIWEGCTMEGIDIGALRRKLAAMGFSLQTVPGGYLLCHVEFGTLQAGSLSNPLTLEQVAAFCS